MNELSKSPINRDVIDARGQDCPWPATLAKRAIDGKNHGEQVIVWTTDPLAPVDLEILCDQLGHRLVAKQVMDDYVATTIEVVRENG